MIWVNYGNAVLYSAPVIVIYDTFIKDYEPHVGNVLSDDSLLKHCSNRRMGLPETVLFSSCNDFSLAEYELNSHWQYRYYRVEII